MKDSDCDLYQLNNYNFIEKHRHDKIGGGVGLYVKENIAFTNRDNLSIFDTDMESIFIEIDKDQLHCKQNIIIGSIYRPPGTDIKLFQEKLKNILTTIQRENKLCYLLGNYNIDLVNCETHNLTAEF